MVFLLSQCASSLLPHRCLSWQHAPGHNTSCSPGALSGTLCHTAKSKLVQHLPTCTCRHLSWQPAPSHGSRVAAALPDTAAADRPCSASHSSRPAPPAAAGRLPGCQRAGAALVSPCWGAPAAAGQPERALGGCAGPRRGHSCGLAGPCSRRRAAGCRRSTWGGHIWREQVCSSCTPSNFRMRPWAAQAKAAPLGIWAVAEGWPAVGVKAGKAHMIWLLHDKRKLYRGVKEPSYGFPDDRAASPHNKQ